MLLQSSLDTHQKLSLLSQDSQYDLACACGTNKNDRRHKSKDANPERWIYPVTHANGGTGFLFKSLLSNVCANDCGYCPLRTGHDVQRCTIEPQALASAFMDYYRARRVEGLFVSSGVIGSPDATMERINQVALLLRKQHGFRGYMHLKIIPGGSDAAIEQAVSLANCVSLNIETAGNSHFSKICAKKEYESQIIAPMKKIAALTASGNRYAKVGYTTQFIVGASDETDGELVKYMGGLYGRMGLDRIYFSAYQRGLGSPMIPGESSTISGKDLMTREHRLYQADFLLRKYSFSANEIPLESNGNLSLTCDPKETWAKHHPEFFPVNLNRASPEALLRVPGLGPITVARIKKIRKEGCRIRTIDDLGKRTARLAKAQGYVTV